VLDMIEVQYKCNLLNLVVFDTKAPFTLELKLRA
jgi:hypothetical protein